MCILHKGTILTEMYLKYFYWYHLFLSCVPSRRTKPPFMIPFFRNTTPRNFANPSQLAESNRWHHLQKYSGTVTLKGETLQNIGIQTPSYIAYYNRRTDFSAIPLRRFEKSKSPGSYFMSMFNTCFRKRVNANTKTSTRSDIHTCINGLLDNIQLYFWYRFRGTKVS